MRAYILKTEACISTEHSLSSKERLKNLKKLFLSILKNFKNRILNNFIIEKKWVSNEQHAWWYPESPCIINNYTIFFIIIHVIINIMGIVSCIRTI